MEPSPALAQNQTIIDDGRQEDFAGLQLTGGSHDDDNKQNQLLGRAHPAVATIRRWIAYVLELLRASGTGGVSFRRHS
jgi:hypothetical protein